MSREVYICVCVCVCVCMYVLNTLNIAHHAYSYIVGRVAQSV